MTQAIPTSPIAAPAVPTLAPSAERFRDALISIRDIAEHPNVPDHLRLYWVSAYTNSLLARMAKHTEEADAWLVQCHALASQMRIDLGEEVTV